MRTLRADATTDYFALGAIDSSVFSGAVHMRTSTGRNQFGLDKGGNAPLLIENLVETNGWQSFCWLDRVGVESRSKESGFDI